MIKSSYLNTHKILISSLTCLGAIPFIVATLKPDFLLANKTFIQHVQSYSVVIISFLSGLHWQTGLTLDKNGTWLIISSILTSLMAWFIFIFSATGIDFILYAGIFLLLLAIDFILYKKKHIADWFITLRCIVTGVVIYTLLNLAVLTLEKTNHF